MSEWFSVEDKMPDRTGDYLCYEVSDDGDENYIVLTYLEGNKHFGFGSYDDVQYWRLLPPPPTETKYSFTEQ